MSFKTYRDNVSHFQTVVLGVTTVTSALTLSTDTYLSQLTVSSSGIINTGNFRIIANQFIRVDGLIHSNGASAISGVGGIAAALGTLGSGSNGGAGGTLTGFFGATLVNSLGGGGGAGGVGVAGIGGVGGIAVAVGVTVGGTKCLYAAPYAFLGVNFSFFSKTAGGAGGGGGGGDNVNLGGGGGAGAGCVMLIAPKIFGSGVVMAGGGAGATGQGGSAAGGGGGGGGIVTTISYNNVFDTGLTIDVHGGLGGAPSGLGTTGINGATGVINAMKASF